VGRIFAIGMHDADWQEEQLKPVPASSVVRGKIRKNPSNSRKTGRQ